MDSTGELLTAPLRIASCPLRDASGGPAATGTTTEVVDVGGESMSVTMQVSQARPVTTADVTADGNLTANGGGPSLADTVAQGSITYTRTWAQSTRGLFYYNLDRDALGKDLLRSDLRLVNGGVPGVRRLPQLRSGVCLRVHDQRHELPHVRRPAAHGWCIAGVGLLSGSLALDVRERVPLGQHLRPHRQLDQQG